jgi:hypothetical protein
MFGTRSLASLDFEALVLVAGRMSELVTLTAIDVVFPDSVAIMRNLMEEPPVHTAGRDDSFTKF